MLCRAETPSWPTAAACVELLVMLMMMTTQQKNMVALSAKVGLQKLTLLGSFSGQCFHLRSGVTQQCEDR